MNKQANTYSLHKFLRGVNMIDLKERRKLLNLSLADVAKKIGVTRQAVFAFEKGIMKPKIEVAKKYAQVLGVPWFEIYE